MQAILCAGSVHIFPLHPVWQPLQSDVFSNYSKMMSINRNLVSMRFSFKQTKLPLTHYAFMYLYILYTYDVEFIPNKLRNNCIIAFHILFPYVNQSLAVQRFSKSSKNSGLKPETKCLGSLKLMSGLAARSRFGEFLSHVMNLQPTFALVRCDHDIFEINTK